MAIPKSQPPFPTKWWGEFVVLLTRCKESWTDDSCGLELTHWATKKKKLLLSIISTGCLMGILVMRCYNSQTTGQYNALYTLIKQPRLFSLLNSPCKNSHRGFQIPILRNGQVFQKAVVRFVRLLLCASHHTVSLQGEQVVRTGKLWEGVDARSFLVQLLSWSSLNLLQFSEYRFHFWAYRFIRAPNTAHKVLVFEAFQNPLRKAEVTRFPTQKRRSPFGEKIPSPISDRPIREKKQQVSWKKSTAKSVQTTPPPKKKR